MGNPILDHFTHSLLSTVLPFLIVFGIAGLLLGMLVKWLERRAVRLGKSIRKTRALRQVQADTGIAPHCPSCNALMVRRKAKRGVNAGDEFWGCPNFPKCRGVREIQ